MNANAGAGISGDIATPPASNGFFGSLLSGPALPALAARLGAKIAAWFGDPIRIGETVIVARHANVMEVLHRDLDFLIAPVNEKRIVEVNGPFVLGMDRGATLVLERGALYQALAEVDFASIRHAVEDEAQKRVAGAGDEIDVVEGLRPADRRAYRHCLVRHPWIGRARRSWTLPARSSGMSS